MRQLTPITNRDQLPKSTGLSDLHSLKDLRKTNEKLRKLNDASVLVEKILNRYPDYSKGKLEYVGALNEAMASFHPHIQDRLTHVNTGISARCKFLPTVADFIDMAYEAAPRAPPKYFKPEPDPPPISEAGRSRMQKLTDDFRNSWTEPGRVGGFTYRPLDEIKSSSDLKTPDGPISNELRRKLEAEGWPYMQQQEDAA